MFMRPRQEVCGIYSIHDVGLEASYKPPLWLSHGSKYLHFLPIGNIVCTQRNDVFTTYTVIFWGLDCRQRLTIALWKESQLIMSTQHDEASGKR